MNFYKIDYVWKKILDFFQFTRKQEEKKKKEYPLTDSINITEIFASRLKNNAVTDRTVSIIGTSKRAKLLADTMKEFNSSLGKITAMSLGVGGVVVAPYVFNKKIYFDFIDQDNLAIDVIHGNDIFKCVVNADTIEERKNEYTYRLFRYYEIKNGVLYIIHKAERDATDIPLTDVAKWADYPEQIAIGGVSKMPFAFIKCPRDNKKTQQVMGVPITYGCDDLIKQVKKCLEQFEDEFDAKETRIFIDSVMFGQDNRLDKVYKKVTTHDGQMIDVYDPAFRQQGYIERLQVLFELLEKKVGTSSGILTRKESQGATTATEIKSENLDTYALVSEIHEALEKGIADFVDACNIMANYYALGQVGDYEVKIEWDYSLIENSTETFAQLVQGQSIGAVSKAEVRQFVYPHETKEEAQRSVDEIKATEPSVMDNFGENLPEGA